jgi:etoposide-induced 2.4 mRNA
MAMHAHPVPLDPYSPLPSVPSTASMHHSTILNTEETIRHPSPFIPIRFPIFAIVLWLNDWIVRIISVGGRSGGKSGRMRSTGKRRTLSDGFEKAEEGIELDVVAGRGNRRGIEQRKVK